MTNISTYAKVKYEGVYPGVDLVYYGNQGQLEYDFIVAPGANPGLVTLAFEGTREIHIDARGELVLGVEGGEVRQHKPVVYQELAGVKQEVAGHYVLKGKRQVGFQVADYDPSRPLIIDPVLVYSTYLGGNTTECGQRHRRGRRGQRLRDGRHELDRFPDDRGGGPDDPRRRPYDAFVTKLDATGSGLVYSTYLGGSGGEYGQRHRRGRRGQRLRDGLHALDRFPDDRWGGPDDLRRRYRRLCDQAGRDRIRAGLFDLPGRQRALKAAHGIAVDGAGSAYVTGVTPRPISRRPRGRPRRPSPALRRLCDEAGRDWIRAGLFDLPGRQRPDFGKGIAVDGAGSAYVTGYTFSTDFPTTAGAAQTTHSGGTLSTPL